MEIHVLQGEREMASNNRTIGKFHLTGIPPSPRGVPQIEVAFDIDANGILNVSAKDLGTGKEQNITITASSGLSEDEVEKMVKDSEQHAEEDKKQREAVDAKNQADSMVYQTEKLLQENADKIGADDKAKIEGAIERVKAALKKEDAAEIKSATEDLNQAWHTVSQEMYKQATAAGAEQAAGAGPEAGPQPPPPGGEEPKQSPEGEVIDAEFEVEDEGKGKK